MKDPILKEIEEVLKYADAVKKQLSDLVAKIDCALDEIDDERKDD